jgi:alpha-beta hydrolase superfamily lysophospholipase
MDPVEKSFAGVGGTKIVYDVWEPESEPEGLLVVAHGLGEHKGRYHHVARRLTSLGLRVVVPDHKGHGLSGGKRLITRSMADFSADLDTLRKATLVDGRPTYLLGHSMGGCIALDYALDHQDLLAGLVLSGAAVKAQEPPALQSVAKVVGRLVPGLPTQALDASYVSKDPVVVKAYVEDPLVWHGKVPAGIAGAMFTTMASFRTRLPGLRIPLLVMTGSEDKLVDPDGSRIVDELAGSSDKTLTVYDGLYHEIFNEPEQDRVLDDLANWLQAHLPTS